MAVKRIYPEAPLVGVGGMVLHQGNVLLVQRGKPPAEHIWTLPGGMVELGESIADALQREVYEECHLLVAAQKVLGVFEMVDKDKEGRIRYHYVVIDMLAKLRSPATELRNGDDAHAARWVPLEQLDDYRVPSKAQAIIGRGVAASAGNNVGCPLLDP